MYIPAWWSNCKEKVKFSEAEEKVYYSVVSMALLPSFPIKHFFWV